MTANFTDAINVSIDFKNVESRRQYHFHLVIYILEIVGIDYIK
jgi:hypothetical protein